MLDDTLKRIDNYLADADKRDRAAAEHTKTTADGFAQVARAVEKGFQLIADAIRDTRR